MTGFGWRLPAPPLRPRVFRAFGLGALGVMGLGLVARSWLDLQTQPLAAVALFGVMSAAAISRMGRHHPFSRFGPANHVTMVRCMLLALVASAIAEPVRLPIAWAAAATTTLIAALDGVDGWLARRTRMASAFGARFDLETDAFCILVLSVLVWQYHKAGPWVLGSGLLRYTFVAAGWVLPWLSRPLGSTTRGKAVAAGQFVALGIALAPVVPVSLSGPACATAVAALVWSFAIDVRFLWRHRIGPVPAAHPSRVGLESPPGL